jgi:ABC-type transport system substrate-binding protein
VVSVFRKKLGKRKISVAEQNAGYWDGEVSLYQVVFKVIPNPAIKTLNFRNGNTDIFRVKSAAEFEESLGKHDINIFMGALNLDADCLFSSRIIDSLSG